MNVQDLVNRVEKRFGKEIFSKDNKDINFQPTGSLKIDKATGGGAAIGRVICLQGMESSGKTSITLHLCAQIQKRKEKNLVCYLDTENGLDLDYANQLEVNTKNNEKWLLCQPDTAEICIEIAKEMIQTPEVGIVVIDSVASMIPLAVVEGEAGDAKIGLLARLLSAQLPIMAQMASKNDCIVLLINQYRDIIGSYGGGNTTPGGKAPKFYASQIWEIMKCGQEKVGDEVVAGKSRLKQLKSKVSKPFGKCELILKFGEGIDFVEETIELGSDFGFITKKGSWYSFGEEKLGQGTEGVRKFLNENPKIYRDVRKKISKEILKMKDPIKHNELPEISVEEEE